MILVSWKSNPVIVQFHDAITKHCNFNYTEFLYLTTSIVFNLYILQISEMTHLLSPSSLSARLTSSSSFEDGFNTYLHTWRLKEWVEHQGCNYKCWNKPFHIHYLLQWEILYGTLKYSYFNAISLFIFQTNKISNKIYDSQLDWRILEKKNRRKRNIIVVHLHARNIPRLEKAP